MNDSVIQSISERLIQLLFDQKHEWMNDWMNQTMKRKEFGIPAQHTLAKTSDLIFKNLLVQSSFHPTACIGDIRLIQQALPLLSEADHWPLAEADHSQCPRILAHPV